MKHHGFPHVNYHYLYAHSTFDTLITILAWVLVGVWVLVFIIPNIGLKFLYSFAPGGWSLCLKGKHKAYFFGYTYRAYVKQVRAVSPDAPIKAGFTLFSLIY